MPAEGGDYLSHVFGLEGPEQQIPSPVTDS